jgi:hypothetical protein
MKDCWMSTLPRVRPSLNAYCKKRLWIVWYETRPVRALGAWDRTSVTVIADSTDEAYSEAATDLGERFELRFPIRCYPLPTRGELTEADRAFEEP